jgi:hypothetical protein
MASGLARKALKLKKGRIAAARRPWRKSRVMQRNRPDPTKSRKGVACCGARGPRALTATRQACRKAGVHDLRVRLSNLPEQKGPLHQAEANAPKGGPA